MLSLTQKLGKRGRFAKVSIVLLSPPLASGELNPVKKKMSPRKMKHPRKKKRYVFTLGVGLI